MHCLSFDQYFLRHSLTVSEYLLVSLFFTQRFCVSQILQTFSELIWFPLQILPSYLDAMKAIKPTTTRITREKANPPQSGAVTHHQDQVIVPVSFSTRNTMNTAPKSPIPPLCLCSILHFLFYFFHEFFVLKGVRLVFSCDDVGIIPPDIDTEVGFVFVLDLRPEFAGS